jgi:hypothetical protein
VDEEINTVLQEMKDRSSLGSSITSRSSFSSLGEEEEEGGASKMVRLFHERHALKGLHSSLRHVARLTEEEEAAGTSANRCVKKN